jgi:hypothetical protein
MTEATLRTRAARSGMAIERVTGTIRHLVSPTGTIVLSGTVTELVHYLDARGLS